MDDQNHVKFLERPGLPRLAYCATAGSAPGVVFLGGFGSDMTGAKATALEQATLARGGAYLRLDYSGHGQSGGRFIDGSIGDWFADAPDFTIRLLNEELTDEQRETLLRDKVLYRPSDYGDPMPITLKLVEDGNRHLLLDKPVPFTGPVRLLHGQRDPDVPWRIALEVAAAMESDDVRVVLVKDGDHRLSRRQDIQLIVETVEGLTG